MTPSRRALGAVGCVAEVRVNQELPDGRSNIVVVGGSRFRVSHLLEESQPYLVAMVQTFEDEAGTQPSMEESASLRHLAVQYFAGLRELNDEPPDEVVLPEDSLALTFHVAGSIACDLGIKQRLMEERSTARRLRALLLLLPVLTRSLEKGITVHRQAHSNGKGGSMPDLLSSS